MGALDLLIAIATISLAALGRNAYRLAVVLSTAAVLLGFGLPAQAGATAAQQQAVRAVAEPPTRAAAPAAAITHGARLVVANAGEEGRIEVVDGSGEPVPGSGFNSAFGSADVVVAADVAGDNAVEVINVNGFANDGAGLVTVFDVASGKPISELTFDTAFDSGDRAATGDVNGDGTEELLIGNDEGGRIDVHDIKSGQPLEGFGIVDTTLDNDSNNGFAVGDVDGDGRVEVLIANKSGGRIDVLDPDTGGPKAGFGVLDTTFNNEAESEFAVGDVDDDGRAEVLVANFGEGGRIDVLDPATPGKPKRGFGVADTTFNNTGENQFKVADVDGDGRAEALIANADEGGRIDVLDPDAGGPKTGFGVLQTGFDDDDIFAVSNFGTGDLDGDGIPDRVERRGIVDENGSVVLDLEDLGASPCRKDVVVEIDYMVDDSGDSDDHSHKPVELDIDGDQVPDGVYPALDQVRDAFDSGRPVDGVDGCPYDGADDGDGINLISIVDEAIEEQTVVDADPGGADDKSDIDRLKDAHFDLALRPYVHYNLWIHDYQEKDKETGIMGVVDAGGRASPSNSEFADDQDFLVTVGGGTRGTGDVQQQALTYMHELGHVLGLRHGGDEDINCKPNYLSVMNYTYALTGLFTANGSTNFLDFSREELTPDGGLDENNLVEPDGVDGPALQTMWSDKSGTTQTGDASGPLDWSGDDDDGSGGDDDDGTDDDDPDVEADINVVGGVDCKPNNAADEALTGFNDWAELDEDLDPVPVPANNNGNREPTSAEAAILRSLWDQALFPDTDVQLEPPRASFDGNVLGVAVDNEHVYATHGYRSIGTPATSDRPGTLVILDRQTMSVEARIRVGFGPNAVAVNPITNRAYVVNLGKDSFSLSVIDTVARQVVDEIDLGQGPIDVAVNTRLNRVYVSNPFQQQIHVIDGATNTKLAPIPMGPAHGLAIDETTNTIYTTLTRRLGGPLPAVTALGAVIDDGVNRPQVLPTVDLTGVFEPVDVAVDPIGDRLYVATRGNPTHPPAVVVLDQVTRRQITNVRTRGPVRAVAVNPGTQLVLAAGDRGVDVVDAAELQVTREMNPGIVFSVATATGSDRQLYAGDFVTGQLHRLSYSSGEPR